MQPENAVFENKKIVVVGCSSGIGYAVAICWIRVACLSI